MIERKDTGIPGLDGMIMGGFPIPSVILVGGEPGTGKTTFTVQSLFHGARNNDTCVYISAISEPQWVVQKFLSTFKFYNQRLVEEGNITFLDIGKVVTGDPKGILEAIKKIIERFSPDRMVIDPITPIKYALGDKIEMRGFLHELFGYLKAFSCVTLITGEMSYSDLSTCLESYMVDGVLILSYPEEENIRRKFLEVLKMRGTKHTTGRQIVDITENGYVIQPGLR